MKKIISVILAFVLALTGISTDLSFVRVYASSEETEDESLSQQEIPEFLGLDDEDLLQYVQGNIYNDLTELLDTDSCYVESVEAIYYPKEYIEELEYNSKENIYFGYTSSELNEEYAGKKYIFTLGEDGQTKVVELETFDDDAYNEIMKNVLIGTGVILICVTISVAAAGVGVAAASGTALATGAKAVSLVFAASAATATTFAREGAALSGVTAAIATGYQTEDFEQALKAGATAASDGFKWGAITGAVVGGASEGWAIKKAGDIVEYTKVKTLNMDLVNKAHPETGVRFVKRKLTYSDGQCIEGVFAEFPSAINIQLPKEYYKTSFASQKKYLSEALKEQLNTSGGRKALSKVFSENELAEIAQGIIPDGYVWHHNESEGLMQLVDAVIHDKTAHTGGMSLWGKGY